MPNAMVALANLTLSTSATSITFASIPGTYRDLRLVVNAAVSPSEGVLNITFNGDTSNNYYHVNMRCYSTSSTGSSTSTNSAIISNYSTGLQPSSRALNTYEILDYSQDKHKTVLVRANHTDELDTTAARWGSTSAITSITVNGGNYTAGSTFCLYGIVSS